MRHPCYYACLPARRIPRPWPTPAPGPEGTGHQRINDHGRELAPARQHGRSYAGTGISTRHPSTTPVGLVLGPDSPRADPPGPGTLGHSALGTLTLVIATHACILTPTPSTPGSLPSFTQRRTLPYHPPRPTTPPQGAAGPYRGGSAASAARLSPAQLSAHDHSTSELLRTLSRMAASEPTSWLSPRPHILSHLARAWGP